MKSHLQGRLVVSGVLALVFLWGCAAQALVFSAARGQVPEQVNADTRSCQQMAEQAPAAYDQFVRPPFRNIEPRSRRVQINCMTGLGYLAFMTHGQTMDQFKAEMQVCVPTVLRAKKSLSDDDLNGIADCMAGRGYSVAGPNFVRGPK
ncbi:MAG: hypothetical protein EXR36_11640 [Betaproteobacteria bacterium]|nr:hypothetical protein [Betaproteobacteria bacterium]